MWNNLGTCYFLTGQTEQAVAAYTAAIKLGAPGADLLYNDGCAELKLEHVDQAEKRFREADTAKPRDAKILGNLALSLHRQGKLGQAIASYKSAIEIDPDDPVLLQSRAWLVSKTAKCSRRRRSWRRSWQCGRIRPAFTWRSGRSRPPTVSTDSAIAYYKEAVALRPGEFAPQFNLGGIYARQAKYEEAADSYRVALQLKPGDLVTTADLGWSLYSAGRLPEAAENLEAVARQDPSNVKVLRGLAAIYTSLKDSTTDEAVKQDYRTKAIKLWNEVVHLDSKDSAAAMNLGDLYRELNDLPNAYRQYQAAVGVDPANVHARLGLAWVLVQENKLDDAIERSKKCDRLESQPGLGPQ